LTIGIVIQYPISSRSNKRTATQSRKGPSTGEVYDIETKGYQIKWLIYDHVDLVKDYEIKGQNSLDMTVVRAKTLR